MSVRNLAAFGLLYIVFAGVPAGIPMPSPDVPTRPVPSAAMREEVEPVAAILRNADIIDRAIFAEVWEQAAEIVLGEDDDIQVSFDNTLGLRTWTAAIANASWKRVAKATGKYPGLSDAIEGAFSDVIGNEIAPVTDEMIEKYAELCRALAWAGMPTDQ